MGLPEYGMWGFKSSSLTGKIIKWDYRILKEPTYIYTYISNRPETTLLKDAKSTVEVDRNCQNDTTNSRYVLIAHGNFKVILEDTWQFHQPKLFLLKHCQNVYKHHNKFPMCGDGAKFKGHAQRRATIADRGSKGGTGVFRRVPQ